MEATTTAITETEELSLLEYSKRIGKHRQTVLVQIWENRLPEGVTAKQIGRYYIIIAPKQKKS